MHWLDQLPADTYVSFPKGNFSIIRIYCPVEEEWHDYDHKELRFPIKEKNEVAKKLIEIDERLTKLEKEIEGIKSSQQDKIEEVKKELQDSFAGFLAEQLSKQSVKASKGAPYT